MSIDEITTKKTRQKGVNAEFGYRSATEIFRFICQAKSNDDAAPKLTDAEILDAAIVQKLLPKLHGSRKKLEPVLERLWKLCFTGSGKDLNIAQEPVEITIEPDGITILNCPGPDRSIPMSAIEKGDSLKSRRYRNRRLGDFLKELDLTEGRSTGVPTIQEKLAANGSPRATFETTEDRLTFLIHIPVHAGCDSKLVSGADKENSPVTTETTTEKTTEKNDNTTEKTTEKIIRLMRDNPQITNKELADACGITEDGVYWNTKKLKKNNAIRRVGGDKGGHWEVLI